MKDRLLSIIKYVVALIFAITAVVALFYFFDDNLNGMFVNWFSEKFVGNEIYGYAALDYYTLKKMFLAACIVIVVTIVSAVAISAEFSKRRTSKKTIDEISRMIHTYMHNDTDAFSVFPEKYASVSAEMADIKSDITRKEQMLKEEAARKNDLIAYLAHDLKTPLTSIIGYLSLMEEAPELPPEQKAKYVNITLGKAKRLEEMINAFFDIARYNLQQTVIEKESIDLKYMLIQMLEEFYPILKAHGNSIELDVEDNMTVYADGDELARVFNNILKNAVAYSYADTPISISAFSKNDNVHIAFSNIGKTIPKQKLDSVFDKFFRLDSARSTDSGGAGLGLAIAKEIITLHGGSITAKSENESTHFEVILPIPLS